MHTRIYKFFHNIYHSRYHGIYRHAKKLFAFDLALLGLAAVMLITGIFFFFWKPGITDLIDLSISLGNGRIKSGDPVKITVDYTNRSKYQLNNIALALRLPDGFIVDRKQTPENIFAADSTFTSVKELKSGAKGQAQIYGWFWGEPNKEQRITASMTYEPASLNRQEQKLAVFSAMLPESILQTRLSVPTTSYPNVPLKFTYTLTNTGSQTITGINLSNNWPGGDIMQEKDTQNISLPPNGIKVINGQITIPGKSGKYSLQITPQILINNHLIPQTPSEQKINTYSPDLISIAELTTNSLYAEPGQIIPVKINWENKGDFKLQDLHLHLATVLPKIVDWAKTAKENNAKTDQNGLVVDAISKTSLSDGNPGASGSFTINLYLLSSFDLSQTENAYLELVPTMEAGMSGISAQNFTQEGTRVRLPLATDLNLSAEARYYTAEGDQLGRGPLPPQAGKTTKYWVFINVSNAGNAVDNASFSAILPSGVELTGKQSVSIGPELKYDPATRKIAWSYDSLPAYSQTGIYFEVSVTPDSSQIGKNITLADSIIFSATDDFTNKVFNLTSPPVTNILNKNDRGHLSGSQVAQ